VVDVDGFDVARDSSIWQLLTADWEGSTELVVGLVHRCSSLLVFGAHLTSVPRGRWWTVT
jgi:hypothetical protein